LNERKTSYLNLATSLVERPCVLDGTGIHQIMQKIAIRPSFKRKIARESKGGAGTIYAHGPAPLRPHLQRHASTHPYPKVYPDPRSVRPPYPRRKKTATPARIRTDPPPRSHDDPCECKDEGVVRTIRTCIHTRRTHIAPAAHEDGDAENDGEAKEVLTRVQPHFSISASARVCVRTSAARSQRVPYHTAGERGGGRGRGLRWGRGCGRRWEQGESERRRRRNERVPNHRQSLRAGERCTRTHICTPSPSTLTHSSYVCVPIPACVGVPSPSARFAISIHLRRQAHEIHEVRTHEMR
jgi:hypothetical protein